MEYWCIRGWATRLKEQGINNSIDLKLATIAYLAEVGEDYIPMSQAVAALSDIGSEAFSLMKLVGEECTSDSEIFRKARTNYSKSLF